MVLPSLASAWKSLFAKVDAAPVFRKEQGFYAYMNTVGQPVWTPREYSKFAQEAYSRNVVAHRAIGMIAKAAASVPWLLYHIGNGQKVEVAQHPLLTLLDKPNPACAGAEFFESVITYRMISGNAYIRMIAVDGEAPKELYVLRPDRVMVIAGRNGMPAGYRYTVGEQVEHFPVNRINGRSNVLHLKYFHPLHDWYGLSPIEAAAYSIDQHNQAAAWNQAMLQNGARPSGALVVKTASDGTGGHLSEEQYMRIKAQIDEGYGGAANAGRPLLLEGGLEWKEMSLSPKDMDFIEAKNSAARDIALALGVPPQLLGIPGDNTYSNLQEARIALWEETILPLLDYLADVLNHALTPLFGANLKLEYDTDAISALSGKREMLWERLEKASFLTENEKRQMAGFSPLINNASME